MRVSVILALWILSLAYTGVAAAEEVPEAPEPAYTLSVPIDTKEGDVKLTCPTGTRQLGGAGAQARDGAVYCVEWPMKKGEIPVKQGPGVRYHDGGGMSEQGSYKDNKRHGVWVAWDEDGKKKSVVTWGKGEYDGLYVTYWANGERQSEIQWKAGKKHGTSKTWGDDGKPLSVVVYEEDRAVKRTDYGPDGKPIR